MFLGDSKTYNFRGPRKAVVRDVAQLLWRKGLRRGDRILKEQSGNGLAGMHIQPQLTGWSRRRGQGLGDLPEDRSREDWTSLISFADKLVAPTQALRPEGLGDLGFDYMGLAAELAKAYIGGGDSGGGSNPYSQPNGAAQPAGQQQQTTGVQPTSGQGTQTSQSVVTSQNVNVQTGGTQGGFNPGPVSATQTPSFTQDIKPTQSISPTQSQGPTQGQYGYPQYPTYAEQPYYPQYGNPQVPLQGAYTSQSAGLPQTVTGAPTSYGASGGGIPMNYLLIGGGVLALLLLMKKRG